MIQHEFRGRAVRSCWLQVRFLEGWPPCAKDQRSPCWMGERQGFSLSPKDFRAIFFCYSGAGIEPPFGLFIPEAGGSVGWTGSRFDSVVISWRSIIARGAA